VEPSSSLDEAIWEASTWLAYNREIVFSPEILKLKYEKINITNKVNEHWTSLNNHPKNVVTTSGNCTCIILPSTFNL